MGAQKAEQMNWMAGWMTGGGVGVGGGGPVIAGDIERRATKMVQNRRKIIKVIMTYSVIFCRIIFFRPYNALKKIHSSALIFVEENSRTNNKTFMVDY